MTSQPQEFQSSFKVLSNRIIPEIDQCQLPFTASTFFSAISLKYHIVQVSESIYVYEHDFLVDVNPILHMYFGLSYTHVGAESAPT